VTTVTRMVAGTGWGLLASLNCACRFDRGDLLAVRGERLTDEAACRDLRFGDVRFRGAVPVGSGIGQVGSLDWLPGCAQTARFCAFWDI
jgi:hypothetical protein